MHEGVAVSGGWQNQVVCEVLERLLLVGIADADHEIREITLKSLNKRLDPLLSRWGITTTFHIPTKLARFFFTPSRGTTDLNTNLAESSFI